VEFVELIRGRSMTRSFTNDPVQMSTIESCVDAASRAPSAGRTQGWNLLMWQGAATAQYWDIALPREERASFAFPGLLRADVVMLSLADRHAYLERYSEPDKGHTDLGGSLSNWPAPYWTIDAAFATMTLLLALHDAGLGALFFAHAREDRLRGEFALPDNVEILGALAIGHRDPAPSRRGRSADRPRRPPSEIIHHRRW
jgi:nitroreductase